MTRTTGLRQRDAFDRQGASAYIPLGISGAFAGIFPGFHPDCRPESTADFRRWMSVRTHTSESKPPAVHAACTARVVAVD
jgi:hypothetical protein